MRKGNHFLTRALALTMVGAMSVSVCPVQASAEEVTTQTSQNAEGGSSSYVYGTVNLPYADYYYGELNEVKESADIALDAEDKAADLRAEGYLDAISSATTSKWKMYSPTYYAAHENEDGGGYIYGIADCSVAVPSALYEAAKKYTEDDIEDKTQCKNALLSIIASLKVNEDQSVVPTEYKVLNGDGTLTEMKDSAKLIQVDTTVEGSEATASIANSTQYGDYQIDITDENLPERDAMQGAVMEAVDDKGNVTKYAFLHSDNLWFQTGHIAFAAKDGFVVHNANTLKYKQFADMQGKTIRKVTYLVRGGADVEYTMNLYCKYLLEDEYGYTGENVVYADGAVIQMVEKTPADSSYTLASVTFGKNELTAGTDYVYDEKAETLTIKKTANTGIGTYTLTYSDKKYENISVNVQFMADMKADDIKIEDNRIVISKADVDIAEYVSSITSITVNGSQLRVSTGVINSDGSVNFDAEINFKGNTTVVFPDKGKDYTIAITASGYPSVEGTVTSPKQETIDTTALQEIIAQAQGLKKTDYTVKTWDNMQAELTKALEELKTPHTQAIVDETVSRLKKAISDLVKEETSTQTPTTEKKATVTPPTTEKTATVTTPTTEKTGVVTSTNTTESVVVKKGDTYSKGSLDYKVTTAETGKGGTVEVTTVNNKITSITVPDSVTINNEIYKVTSVSQNAFANCKKLKKIVIGKNVTTIGKNAFKNASVLKTITIKSTKLKKIGSGALKGINKSAVVKVPSAKLKTYQKLFKGKGQGKNVKIKK